MLNLSLKLEAPEYEINNFKQKNISSKNRGQYSIYCNIDVLRRIHDLLFILIKITLWVTANNQLFYNIIKI
jgi:hypothetical protein